jgi:hypothetical protein
MGASLSGCRNRRALAERLQQQVCQNLHHVRADVLGRPVSRFLV